MRLRSCIALLMIPLLTILGMPGQAIASSVPFKTNTVMLNGHDWLDGNGVDVYSNDGNYGSNESDFNYLSGNRLTGYRWQCVELINRLYRERGWINSYWPGYAKDMFDSAPSGLAKSAQGQIDSVHPGDVIVMSGGSVVIDQNGTRAGHVVIVDQVDGNVIHVVQQNAGAARATLTKSGSSIVPWSGYGIVGVVHTPDSSPVGSSTSSSSPSSPGMPQDGMVVEDVTPGAGGHYYAVAGRSLFWFNKDDPTLRAAFIGQMQRRYGTDQTFKMTAGDIHALEGSPWANPRRTPDDNTFMYEQGSPEQYMMQYGKAFPVVAEEMDYLNGRDKATMAPAGALAPLVASTDSLPDLPNSRLLKAEPNPDYYETEAGQFYYANNMTVVDCLFNGHKYTGTPSQSALQPVPASLIQLFLDAGRNTGQIAHCTLPDTIAFYGPGGHERWHIAGSNPYSRSLYTSPLAMRCWLGSHPAEEQISLGGINQPVQLEDRNCPDNTYLRNNQTQQVFQVWDGVLHYIATPETLSCLTEGHPDVVRGLDEAEFGGAPQGGNASCAFEGKLVQAPAGQTYWVKDGAKHYVGNQQILNCVRVRANGGDPIPVPQATIDAYLETYGAYCPYPAEVRFVRGEGQAAVWRVFADGTRQHAQGLCDPATDPRYQVYVMPAGEVDGHRYTGELSPSPSVCAAIQ